MFRWFAPDGVKVVPTKEELENGFGFYVRLVDRRKEGRVELSLINDAHPANHWRFTVSRFSQSDAAFTWLTTNNLKMDDVLWARFGEQDIDAQYDAEHIRARFNYKQLNSADAHQTIDGEIKGREFPVVVIDGFPSGVGSKIVSDSIWLLRRQLYLCASRATAFLFFIFKERPSDPESAAMSIELDTLLAALSGPTNPQAASTKTWAFRFNLPESPAKMDVFLDEVAALNQETDSVTAEQNAVNTAEILPINEATDLKPAFDDNQNHVDLPAVPEVPPTDFSKSAPFQSPERPITSGNEIIAPKENPSSNGNLGKPRRIHEVARNLGWEPTRLITLLTQRGYPFRSVSEPIDAVLVDSLLHEFHGTAASQNVSPEGGVSTRSSAGVTNPAKTSVISEKDFQRQYGQEKGWRQSYAVYLKTGLIPAHLRAAAQRRHDTTKARQMPVATIEKKFVSPPKIMVRQLAQYLGVKPFAVIKVLMNHRPTLVPADLLSRSDVDIVCNELHRPTLSHMQLLTLSTIPAPVSA